MCVLISTGFCLVFKGFLGLRLMEVRAPKRYKLLFPYRSAFWLVLKQASSLIGVPLAPLGWKVRNLNFWNHLG